jgi:hypothetical protein
MAHDRRKQTLENSPGESRSVKGVDLTVHDFPMFPEF